VARELEYLEQALEEAEAAARWYAERSATVDVSCSDDELTVVLDDGRSVSVPLEWFPRLAAATPRQRRAWEPIGGGIGIHWDAIDEDISVAGLLQPERFMRLAESALKSAPGRTPRKAPARKSTRARRDAQRLTTD
jgi:hypothetical protein